MTTRLVIVFGLPGSGKTTFARAFSGKTGLLHLNSDRLRRELGLMGRYRPEDKQRVYDALFERAEQALAAGQGVIVDGTFFTEALREPFRLLAERCAVPIRWVEVRASEATVRERMHTPRADSEADFEVYQKIKAAAEPLAEPHLMLWSDSAGPEEMVKSAVEFCQK